jgi:hypothetical protein
VIHSQCDVATYNIVETFHEFTPSGDFFEQLSIQFHISNIYKTPKCESHMPKCGLKCICDNATHNIVETFHECTLSGEFFEQLPNYQVMVIYYSSRSWIFLKLQNSKM